MSAPMVDGLRALCPECYRPVRVRRQGVAHGAWLIERWRR